MLGSTQWSRFLMGAGLAMACGLTVAAAGVEDSAIDADGEAAFRRLVATASMRFPDDPTMRALILREADPSWSDSFSELAALELTEGAVPLIALFDPPIPPDHVIYDEVELRVWGEAWGEFFSASILEPGTMRRTSEVAEDLLDRRGDFAELREGALLDAAEVSRGPESLPSSWRMSARRLYDGYPVRAGLVGDGRVAVFPVERTWETHDITVDSCSLEELNGVSYVKWSEDGRWLAVVEWMGQSRVSVVDVANLRMLGQTSMGVDVEDVAFVPDGSRLIVLTENGRTVMDAMTGARRPLASSDPKEWATLVAPPRWSTAEATPEFPTSSPDGRWRVELDEESTLLQVRELATGKVAGSTGLPGIVENGRDSLHAFWMTNDRLCVYRQRGTTAPSDDWLMVWEVPGEDSAWVQMGLENIDWMEESQAGSLAITRAIFSENSRLVSTRSPQNAARITVGGTKGVGVDWSPLTARFVEYSGYGGDLRFHDADWSLRRQKLWDRIPAVLTPMQRMQYLGESPEVARRTWKAQMQRNR